MHERTCISILSLLAFVVMIHACMSHKDDVDADPRLGERGKVRFTDTGCSTSTTLAVGSTAIMTLEPQGEPLPEDLVIRSMAPEVIEASTGSSRDEVVLTALETGEAEVELVSAGNVWDSLGFGAEPASSLTSTSPGAVFSGGIYHFKIDEVYGACGSECPLIGGEFVDWSSSPSGSLVLDREVGRTALFLAGPPNVVTLLGDEPSAGTRLVDRTVTIVTTEGAGEIGGRIVVMLPDETILEPQPSPLDIPAGSLFQVQLFAPSGDLEVPVGRHDAVLAVEGDTSAIEEYALGDVESPEGAIFGAVAPGSVTILATVPILSQTGSFEIAITG